MNKWVLDASAVLAVLDTERGYEKVVPHLAGGLISTVNYSEVLKKSVERGGQFSSVVDLLDRFMLSVIDFSPHHAMRAAEIWPAAKAGGLSFADRACLALGLLAGAHVLTGDKKMSETGLPVRVKLFRERN